MTGVRQVQHMNQTLWQRALDHQLSCVYSITTTMLKYAIQFVECTHTVSVVLYSFVALDDFMVVVISCQRCDHFSILFVLWR